MLFVQQVINGTVAGADYIILALGLSMVFGVMRVVNFAHGEYFMLGGLTGYLLTDRLNVGFGPAVLLALVVGAAGGLVTYWIFIWPLRNRSGGEEATFISTFGLSFIILYATDLYLGGAGRNVRGITGTVAVGGIKLEDQQLFATAVVALALVLIFLLLHRTRAGKEIRAVAQDPEAARLLGIRSGIVYSATFVIGGALAALAGVSVAPLTGVNPYSGQQQLIIAFVVVVVGGMGSLVGTVVAALAIGIITALVSTYLPGGWSAYVPYALLLLILVLRPNGLFGRAASANWRAARTAA